MTYDFFGLDEVGRPYMPPFHKLWFEDGGYKGYIWRFDNKRFYFNDIPVKADAYWGTLYELAFGGKQ